MTLRPPRPAAPGLIPALARPPRRARARALMLAGLLLPAVASAQSAAPGVGASSSSGAGAHASASHAIASSPAGLWKSIDDVTGKPRALIRLLEHEGAIVGRIERILVGQADARCERCTDERKDQPVQGMTILTGLRREGDRWSGGRILDPENGKTYSSQLRLLDEGRRLEMRGYIGTPMIGRTQVWHREH
jgi:uncharacterized protein (DUF2147 family)